MTVNEGEDDLDEDEIPDVAELDPPMAVDYMLDSNGEATPIDTDE